jgi:DNA-binding transcriptional ArsR family regulator
MTDTDLDTGPFEVLANESRAAILRALAAHQSASPRAPALTFAELRERAGVADSGNFNYHLDQLQDHYVRGTDDGYVLTYPGVLLMGTLRAGVGVDTERGPVPVDGTCDVCGADLQATYERGLLAVHCENDHVNPQNGVPPNAVADRDLSAVLDYLTLRTQQQAEQFRRGWCPLCAGDATRRTVESPGDGPDVLLQATCGGCGMVFTAPHGLFVLRHPAVVAFYHDHDVDVHEAPYWRLDLVTSGPVERSADPERYTLAVERDGERLELVVDDVGALRDHARRPVGASDADGR